MATSNGRRSCVYDQVLDQARREIDEASSKIDEVRRTLHLMEARAEAAKAVYEAVAARLNLEDELQDETVFKEAPYPDSPPPVQAPEPPEETVSAAKVIRHPGGGIATTRGTPGAATSRGANRSVCYHGSSRV